MRRIVVAGLVGVFAAMAILGALSIVTIRALRAHDRSTAEVGRSHEIITQLEALRGDVAQAESARRGFVLTGQSTAETIFAQSADKLEEDLAGLAALVEESGRHVVRFQHIERLVRAKLTTLSDSVALKRQGVNGSQQVEITERGIAESVAIRGVVAEMMAVEARRLDVQRAASATSNEWLTSWVVVGQSVALSVLLLVYGVLVLQIFRRRAAEFRLRASETRLRRLVDSNLIGVLHGDPNGAVTEANQAVLELLGYDPADIANATLTFDALTPPDAPTIGATHRNTLATAGYTAASETTLLKKDGTPVPAMIGIARSDPSRPDCVAFVLDLSERQAQQVQVLATNAALDEKVRALEVRSREAQIITDLSGLLQTARDETEAHRIIRHYARLLFPNLDGALGITQSSGDLVETVAAWGAGADGDAVFSPDDCWALRTGKVYAAARGGTADLGCVHISGGAPSVCIPLVAHNEALGLLQLQATDRAHVDLLQSTELLRLARGFADTVGLSLANLKLQDSLRRQAIRDPLTNLFNRRYMEESLERELARATRRGTSTAVMMLDVDHFKSFNDTHGHAAGDLVLAELGRLIANLVRGEDIACRYGGEELAVILPDAPLDIARQRAEDVRAGIRALRIEHAGQVLNPVTVSIGVAAFPIHGRQGSELLRQADAALYRAKHAGRDRVVVAGVETGAEIPTEELPRAPLALDAA